MSLSKTYQPADHEKNIYELWEGSGALQLERVQRQKEPFVVVLPPPNANADLHLGYALDSQLKDIIGRWQRLNGRPVLLLPGADHAGFETWAVYEKHLGTLGKSRFDFSREELYRQVYDFVISNKTKMESQIRRLGISCDWQRFTFTLDKKIVDRSYQTFKQMWQDDLIYRGKRLVNYCVAHGTGFSDLEVTYKEISGKLYLIKYPFKDNPEDGITIATTRPETLLGDVAVAVHPDDERYLKSHNQTLLLPLTQKEIPLICDKRVLSDFGTGALKITPGHDFLDFEIGKDAGLEPVEIINPKGQITDQAPTEFRNLDVKEARELVLRRLEEQGCLVEIQDYTHQVGHCYKCGTVLEPLPANQWFVRMQPLAQKAIERLQSDEIKFYPRSKRDELIAYLNQLQDWNISRQIAWGIPIPVFQNEADKDDWIFDDRVEQTTLEINGQTYRRDPDVFDTWWSSGQWPFATIDWPENPDLYPNSLMETGYDILRAWVSRMIVLSLFVTKEIPFKTVYLHGMIIDDQGVKMSKSKGNVINPMEVIDEYGADALRVSLCSRTTAGQPQRFNQSKIILGRNFCNKLWNIGRFVQGVCGDKEAGKLKSTDKISLDSMADNWIWNRFLKTKEEFDKHLDDYQFSIAWDTISNFVWNDLADWYLETGKWSLNQNFLGFLFISTLRLVHPFAPFLTEALYQELVDDAEKPLLINNTWPESIQSQNLKINPSKVLEFEQTKNLILKIRQLLPLELRRQSQLILKNEALLKNNLSDLYQQLTSIPKIRLSAEDHPSGLFVNQESGYEAWVALDKELLEQHLFKLEKEVIDQEKTLQSLQQRLNNQAYLEKAPPHLVAETEQQADNIVNQLQVLKLEINRFKEAL